MKKNKYFPNYSHNCGKCNMCTIKDYLKLDKPLKCPKCDSERAKIEAWNNPNNNWVTCENGHRYNIRQFCDLTDIELHQKTIRKLGL
jgi:hypothetical protein